MTDKDTLQADYDVLTSRVKEKRGELTTAQNDLKQLIPILVDTTDPKERKTLIQKRADLTNLVGALDDELGELTLRRDVANLAVNEYSESQAQEKLNDLSEKFKTARLALSALQEDQQRFHSVGRNQVPQEEADRTTVEFSSRIAKAIAENYIFSRDTQRAKNRLDAAHNETEAVRLELEKAGET